MVETSISVHYWAGARAAAGTAQDILEVSGPTTLAEVTARVLALHPGTRLGDVLAVCATLVDDRPTASEEAAEVTVRPGQSVQFLPPFAGG
ncbi:MoaD/ThiS family protein [Nocardioides sp. BP30]|uniref:MoaD/ThiS family protein n=1 Tax=Nocardioides sp. BP30 TaxID=3036374 RepID=UPI002468D18E|nr:MoaD/ThiS family protein [Nocardioides sp. BP30]WGL52067.1 MoaD/ThiS family protein [Nocardioides sp. BP30]